MQGMQSTDVQMLVQLELERNARVGALVEEYAKLTDSEKALFRLAAGISLGGLDSIVVRRRANNGSISDISPGRIQPLVKDLMKTLLEDYPTLLTNTDVRNFVDRDYCQKVLGIYLAGFPLLRRGESGRKGSGNDGHDRYYVKLYAGKFYVCSQWWKDNHLTNAESLLRLVTELAERDPDHPGIPALERHKRALKDYIAPSDMARM